MDDNYRPVPDGDANDTAEGFRLINNSSSYSENANDLGGHPNQPNDMSSPIKSGGFYPEFFPDDNQFSPIAAQSPGRKFSKGTYLPV